ncbi:MAG: DNA polymerase IV [Anaerolineales bacterium]|nr:DNA polymerase IV [Anaerolineales bacterium]
MMRKIIHLDLDAFFCAVEELRDPSLRGKAFAVGGRPESRGVVASCSYPARRVGVRSAMPMSQALRLCPELIITPARHGEYRTMSRQVMARLRAMTELVEQISIDEAFLDVSERFEQGETLARSLQATIREELALPCSLGVATNKLVAKIANNTGKAQARGSGPPNAICVVPPGEEAAFLAPLPAEELWGVGPKTAARLAELGIKTIGDIAHWPEADLAKRFGKNGVELSRHARGLDDRPIVTQHERKSISQETTFERDVADGAHLRRTLQEQAADVARVLRAKRLSGATIKLKLRWSDFTTLTRQTTLPQPTDDAHLIASAGTQLFEREWAGQPVRLIGIGISGFQTGLQQPTLWDQPDERSERLDAALQSLRARFGDHSIRRGLDLDDEDIL